MNEINNYTLFFKVDDIYTSYSLNSNVEFQFNAPLNPFDLTVASETISISGEMSVNLTWNPSSDGDTVSDGYTIKYNKINSDSEDVYVDTLNRKM